MHIIMIKQIQNLEAIQICYVTTTKVNEKEGHMHVFNMFIIT